jgi:uncharacterized protein with GYD domain
MGVAVVSTGKGFYDTTLHILSPKLFDAPDDAAALSFAKEIRAQGTWHEPLRLFEVREVKAK